MDMQPIPARSGNHNMENYKETYEQFNWDDVKSNFSWSKTGNVNIAYEAIDKHAEDPQKKKATVYSCLCTEVPSSMLLSLEYLRLEPLQVRYLKHLWNKR